MTSYTMILGTAATISTTVWRHRVYYEHAACGDDHDVGHDDHPRQPQGESGLRMFFQDGLSGRAWCG